MSCNIPELLHHECPIPSCHFGSQSDYCLEPTIVCQTFDPVVTEGGGYPAAVEVHGWAWSDAAAMAGLQPLTVSVTVDGELAMTAVANISRPDLVSAGVAPSPNHGFVADLPSELCTKVSHPLISRTVNVRWESTLMQPWCCCRTLTRRWSKATTQFASPRKWKGASRLSSVPHHVACVTSSRAAAKIALHCRQA